MALVVGIASVHAAACGSSDKAASSGAGTPVTLDGGVLLQPGAGGGGGACVDDDGYLPSCDAIAGPADRGCDAATCARIVRSLKSRLASEAVACMREHLSAGESCQGCSALALATSCPDAVAQNACDQLRGKCPGRTFDDCLAVVSGLTFGGRLELIACTTENACAKDIASCLP